MKYRQWDSGGSREPGSSESQSDVLTNWATGALAVEQRISGTCIYQEGMMTSFYCRGWGSAVKWPHHVLLYIFIAQFDSLTGFLTSSNIYSHNFFDIFGAPSWFYTCTHNRRGRFKSNGPRLQDWRLDGNHQNSVRVFPHWALPGLHQAATPLSYGGVPSLGYQEQTGLDASWLCGSTRCTHIRFQFQWRSSVRFQRQWQAAPQVVFPFQWWGWV